MGRVALVSEMKFGRTFNVEASDFTIRGRQFAKSKNTSLPAFTNSSTLDLKSKFNYQHSLIQFLYNNISI